MGGSTIVEPEPIEGAVSATDERWRSVFDSAPGFIIVIDTNGIVVAVNRAPGFPRERLIGRPFGEASTPEDGQRMRDAVAAAMQGEVTRIEVRGPGPGGPGTEWFDTEIGPLRQGGRIVGAVAFTSNITARKRLEAQLAEAIAEAQRSAAALEENNRKLAQEVEERRRAEAALRALSTPIIRVWDDVLALPVIGAVDQARAALMLERLLAEIVRTGASFAILDLTGVERVDQETARYLLDITRAASLLGSRCVLSGVSPAIAATMVQLGVDVGSFTTFGQLQDALRHVLGRAARR